jgi:hypothetical protein
VAEVERLLAVDLDQSALPGAVRRVLEDVAQQDEPGAVVEAICDDHLAPRLERNVEGVRVAELRRRALVDQCVGVDAEIAEHPVRDVGVTEFVLDDPHHGDEGLEPWRVLSRLQIGRCADQLGVTRDDEGPGQALDVVLRRVLGQLDQLPLANSLLKCDLTHWQQC